MSKPLHPATLHAASGLRDLDVRLQAVKSHLATLGIPLSKPGVPAMCSLANEDSHQDAIWKSLLGGGVASLREFPVTAWAGDRRARVDFLLLDDPKRPTTAGSTPIQYKPPWAAVDAVVDDLFHLGMWWPSSSPRSIRRLLWFACDASDADAQVVRVFDQWNAEAAATARRRSSDRWSQMVAAWKPTVRCNGKAEVTGASGRQELFLYEFEVVDWLGQTPAEQWGIDQEFKPRWCFADEDG